MHNTHAKRILAALLSIAMAVPPTTAYAVEDMMEEDAAYQSPVTLVEDEELADDVFEGDVIDEAATSDADDVATTTEEPAVADVEAGDVELQTMEGEGEGKSWVNAFTSPAGGLTFDEEKQTLTLSKNGNHFAVYQDLEKKANDFVIEVDAQLVDTTVNGCPALLFGFPNKNLPGEGWYGANLDTGRGDDSAFRVFIGGDAWQELCGPKSLVDLTRPIHLKLDVKKDGSFTYSFGNTGTQLTEHAGTIPNWQGGYVGLLTWDSDVTFSNFNFVDRTVEETVNTDPLVVNDNFHTNLQGLSTLNGTWEVTEEGLHSNAVGKDNAFMYSTSTGANFVYSTDVKFLENKGAASLLFRSKDATSHKYSYAVNLDAGSNKCKFWRWTDGRDEQLINEKDVAVTDDNTYTLKVVAINDWISYYVNDVLVASSGDYTLQPDDRGQNTGYSEGYFGLLNWNGNMVFQNTYYKAIEGGFDPTLESIEVESSTGTVEKKAQFNPNEPIFIQYVGNDASTVNINAQSSNPYTEVVVTDADGNVYEDGKNVPVSVGKNYINVVSTAHEPDSLKRVSSDAKAPATATLTYRVNVHRRQADAIYYNEPFRDQYHYSVKDGWGNDPNGLVYYKGTYHFFYQFYDDIVWGPMHWGHATSTDLVHWDEQPMALYPDANGAMFSGCIVADETNQSGLFSTAQGGLVALITCDGNGQRIKLAYSEDEGATWTKVRDIAADWTNDPLGSRDFRDPKVFRWEGKWFMVVAGGPLRIYSSPDLVNWTCESTYVNLHTECPDLYPIRASDGTLKWVLSRGGRLYKVGDFKPVNGHWTFVPDAAYQHDNGSTDGKMNFGKDSYAAMTFYVQDFGTAENPTLPDIIEINWMNTWDNYCNAVARTVGQAFNGTYNLALKEGLVKDGDTYVLTQTPIEAYENLRVGDPVVDVTGVEVATENNVLDGFASDCYEIISTFRPSAGTTKVGFQLRVGPGEHTDVVYDLEQKRLFIDRSESGTQLSNRFTDVDSQQVETNSDGSVTMHIFVDRASVEVFSKDYTVAGANQIFPSLGSVSANVLVEGEPATADITVYVLKSIWDKVTTDVPLAMQALTPADNSIYAGDTVNLKVALLPISVLQNVAWEVADPTIAKLESDGAAATATGLKKGVTTVTATSVDNPELSKTFTISVNENNFQTNIDKFVNVGGNWIVDDITLSESNQSSNDFYMAAKPIQLQEYTLRTKIKFSRGLPNIFFAANSTDPFDRQAYALQLNDGTHVRLFRFAGDTLAEGEVGKHLNDDQYHDILITKKAGSVEVAVDGVKCLEYELGTVEDYYNASPYVGLGLWDGTMDVQMFYVRPLGEPIPIDVTDATVTVPEQTYTGEELKPEPTVTLGEDQLDVSLFDVKYEANTNVGTATVKVTAKEDSGYVGRATGTFEIKPADISAATIAAIPSRAYDGKPYRPSPAVTLGGHALAEGADYTLSYAGDVHAGTATLTVTGMGGYAGTATASYRIEKAAQPMTAKAVARTAELYALSKAAQAVAAPLAVSGAKGKVTYQKASGAAQLSVDAATGKVTVKKGTKAGTYKLTIRATAAGDADHEAGSASAECAIRVVDSRKANPMKVAVATKTAGSHALKSKAVAVAPLKVTGAKGKVTYKKASGSAQLAVAASTGKVTVKKGTKAGTYKAKVTVKAAGDASHKPLSKTVTVAVKVAETRKANPMKATAATKNAAAKTLKTKAVAVSPISVKGAKGKVTYKKASGASQLSVAAATGKVTVKKGTKAGTYTAKVTVKAAGDASYKPLSKTVTVKVVVK